MNTPEKGQGGSVGKKTLAIDLRDALERPYSVHLLREIKINVSIISAP